LLVAVGAVILLILVGLGIGVVMMMSGNEDNTTQDSTLLKYQCYNGNVVSKLSDCPKVTTTQVSVSTAVTTVLHSSATSCPKCDCLVYKTTTSPPTTICTHCTSASSCGHSYTQLICKQGEYSGVSYDVWEVTYTPTCENGCCLSVSSRLPKATCNDNEICQDGACIALQETPEE
jgi:hypothetical protein